MIILENVIKTFGTTRVLDEVDLRISDKESVVIVGPSGGGKSTLLRCINWIDPPTSGVIKINGITVNSNNISTMRKSIGIVFQDFHLFPHMTVLDNLIYAPCTVLKMEKKAAVDKAMDLLVKFKIEHKVHDFPNGLSGGQKQRVAISRALMTDPNIVLFDEPTSALDNEVTRELLDMMKLINVTTITVTHQLQFAKLIASRVIFFDQGKVVADQPVDSFFSDSTFPRVKLFLENLIIN